MTDFSNASGTGMFDPFIVSAILNVYMSEYNFVCDLLFCEKLI